MNLESILPFMSFFGTCFVAIFVIIDPFAVVPIFLTLTHDQDAASKKQINRKATLISASILVAIAFFGKGIFDIFGITLPAFQIAGGILLLILGIEQLENKRKRVKKEEEEEGLEKDDISVFPLGTPLLAGPGAISTVVLMGSNATWQEIAVLIVAILCVLLSSYIILQGSTFVYRLLGKTGLNLLTRIMGIILTAVAVQFILNGITGFIEVLKLG